jgi:hypothetical protein
MKIISLIFVTILFCKSCQGQPNVAMETTKIEYTANSRGYYKNIAVQNKKVLETNSRRGKTVAFALTEKQWNSLVTEFKNINLEEIPNWKAPTQKRFHDGAAMANLKITYNGKTYESQTFDNGFPPQEIKKLVQTLLSFSNKEE